MLLQLQLECGSCNYITKSLPERGAIYDLNSHVNRQHTDWSRSHKELKEHFYRRFMMQARPQTNPQSVKCNPENAGRAKGCQNTTTGTTTVQQHQHNPVSHEAYELPGINGSQSTTQGNNCTTEAKPQESIPAGETILLKEARLTQVARHLQHTASTMLTLECGSCSYKTAPLPEAGAIASLRAHSNRAHVPWDAGHEYLLGYFRHKHQLLQQAKQRAIQQRHQSPPPGAAAPTLAAAPPTAPTQRPAAPRTVQQRMPQMPAAPNEARITSTEARLSKVASLSESRPPEKTNLARETRLTDVRHAGGQQHRLAKLARRSKETLLADTARTPTEARHQQQRTKPRGTSGLSRHRSLYKSAKEDKPKKAKKAKKTAEKKPAAKKTKKPAVKKAKKPAAKKIRKPETKRPTGKKPAKHTTHRPPRPRYTFSRRLSQRSEATRDSQHKAPRPRDASREPRLLSCWPRPGLAHTQRPRHPMILRKPPDPRPRDAPRKPHLLSNWPRPRLAHMHRPRNPMKPIVKNTTNPATKNQQLRKPPWQDIHKPTARQCVKRKQQHKPSRPWDTSRKPPDHHRSHQDSDLHQARHQEGIDDHGTYPSQRILQAGQSLGPHVVGRYRNICNI